MTEDDTDLNEVRSGRTAKEPAAGGPDVDWKTVSADPTLESLGYETSEWEEIPVAEDDQVIFLPGREEDLEDDAFVVIAEGDLCDLVTRR